MPLELFSTQDYYVLYLIVISVTVAVIAVVIHYANIAIPHVHSGFVVAGNVVRGV
jgi:hypothetical protein